MTRPDVHPTAYAATGGGVSGVFLLGVAFVILRLTHVINWSWWWVTLPFWGGAALFFALCLLGGFVFLTWFFVSTVLDRRRNRRRNP